MDNETQALDIDKLVTKISLRLIPFMLVLYVVSYLDRINISFAALQMNRDLHLTDNDFAAGGGIFFIGYCLFGMPSNIIISKWGPRRWISSIMVTWGLITVAMCLVKDATTFFILRFILGIAEAGFFPGMILYLTYWFPAKYHGAAVARFMTAIPIAGLIGSGVAAWALGISSHGLAGWMWLFILTGLPAVFLGVTVFFVLPDRPSEAKWLTTDEKSAVDAMLAQEKSKGAELPAEGDEDTVEKGGKNTSYGSASGSHGFVETVKDLMVWRFALLYFSLTVSMYGFQLWLPQIIKAFEASSDQVTALLSAIPAMFQALGMLVIAGHSDRTGERRYHVVLAAGCTCVGLIISCLANSAWLNLLGLCLAAFGIWGSVGPFWALCTNSLKKESHATGIAVVNSVGNLGGFVGPNIVSAFKQMGGGFGSSLIALAVASVFAGILAATSPRRRDGDNTKEAKPK